MSSWASLIQALAGDEGPFLLPLLRGDSPPPSLRAYRTFLEARGDPRGDVLALQDALLADDVSPAQAGALFARLEALLASCDPAWWRCVDRLGGIRNCALGAGGDPVVRFAFECPRRWETLAPTRTRGERYCDRCRQSVYFCATRAEAEAHARAGHCITVPAAIAHAAGREATTMVTGRPDPVEYWGRAIFPGAR